MKIKNLVFLLCVCFVSASISLLTGCGLKTKPVPPANVVPSTIEDLRYSISENGVQLMWSFPTKTIKGGVLDDISSFELLWAEIPLNNYCADCPIPYVGPIVVNGGSPMDGEVRRKVTYDYGTLKIGYKYFFKVRSRNSWFATSADSNVVTFVWFEPAAATAKVKAVASDGRVSLSWQPVAAKAGTTGTIKYQVLRSLDGKEFAKVGEAIAKTDFVDKQLQNGQKYYYKIQTLTEFKNELAEGGASVEVSATPISLVPPAIPTGVTVVPTDVGVKIFWDRVTSPDVAGYNVYRRAADKEVYEQIGTVDATHTLYVDTKAGNDKRYYYSVTAYDDAKPANESAKSKETTIRN